MPSKKSSGNEDFGKSFQELQDIAAWFEKDETDLDEALRKYERGLALAALCRQRLTDAENKVNAIKAKFSHE